MNLQELAEKGRSIRADRLLRKQKPVADAADKWRYLRADAAPILGELIDLVPLEQPASFRSYTSDYRLEMKPWGVVPILMNWRYDLTRHLWQALPYTSGEVFWIATLWRAGHRGHLPECYEGQTANTPAEAVALCLESEQHYSRTHEQMDLLVSAGK